MRRPTAIIEPLNSTFFSFYPLVIKNAMVLKMSKLLSISLIPASSKNGIDAPGFQFAADISKTLRLLSCKICSFASKNCSKNVGNFSTNTFLMLLLRISAVWTLLKPSWRKHPFWASDILPSIAWNNFEVVHCINQRHSIVNPSSWFWFKTSSNLINAQSVKELDTAAQKSHKCVSAKK